MMTAFYMFRLYSLTFLGSFRGTEAQKAHLHESPAAMTIPLIVLAILSVVGGYIGLPPVISEHHMLTEFLGGTVTNGSITHLDHSTEWMLMGISTGLALLMIILALSMHKKPAFAPNTGLAKVLENKWYVDEIYDAIIVKPLMGIARFSYQVVEKLSIDGFVNGIGKSVKWGSERFRLLQSGQVGFYVFVMVLGMLMIFALSVFWIR